MSGDGQMLEIGAALADIAASLERQDELAEAIKASALEVSTPLAEMLEALQRLGPELTKSLTAALAAMPRQPAPTVQVEAPPAQPAPVVNIETPHYTGGWRFDVDYHPNGAIKGLNAKRTPA